MKAELTFLPKLLKGSFCMTFAGRGIKGLHFDRESHRRWLSVVQGLGQEESCFNQLGLISSPKRRTVVQQADRSPEGKSWICQLRRHRSCYSSNIYNMCIYDICIYNIHIWHASINISLYSK